MPGYVTTDARTGKNAWWDGQRIVPMTPALQKQWDSRFLSDQDSGAPDAMSERQQFVAQAKDVAAEAAAYSKIATKRRADLNSFLTNNLNAATGNGLDQIPWVGDAITRMAPGGPGFMGGGGPVSARRAQMLSVQGDMQLANAPKGEGTITNFERDLAAQSIPEIKKDGITNQNLVHRQLGFLDEQGDRIAFRQKYLQTNGHLNGADEAWGRYVSQHPYVTTDPNTGATRYIPPKARQPWDDYFGVRQAAQAQPTMAPRPARAAAPKTQLPPLTRSTAAKYVTQPVR